MRFHQFECQNGSFKKSRIIGLPDRRNMVLIGLPLPDKRWKFDEADLPV